MQFILSNGDHDPNSDDFHKRLGQQNKDSSSGNGGRA